MVNLVPAQVMDEYVREMVRLDVLSRKVLASPIYRRFFAAAPGLPELMVMGKIMVLEEERTGWPRRPKYDLIVVDAPATGHGLAFLKVPLAASNAVDITKDIIDLYDKSAPSAPAAKPSGGVAAPPKTITPAPTAPAPPVKKQP